MTCVSGLPCMRSSGGPEPPTRKWIRAPEVSMSLVVKPSNMAGVSLSFGRGPEKGAVLFPQQLRELVHVAQLFDLPQELEHRIGLLLVQAAPCGALAE